jgi:hypothetical protein
MDVLLLQDLTLNDWLNSLVDVVVCHVLASDSTLHLTVLCGEGGACVLVSVLLLCQCTLCAIAHFVCTLASLNREHGVFVLGLLLDTVSDRLDTLLVVVDMVFAVLDHVQFLGDLLGDLLLDNGRCNGLVGLGG